MEWLCPRVRSEEFIMSLPINAPPDILSLSPQGLWIADTVNASDKPGRSLTQPTRWYLGKYSQLHLLYVVISFRWLLPTEWVGYYVASLCLVVKAMCLLYKNDVAAVTCPPPSTGPLSCLDSHTPVLTCILAMIGATLEVVCHFHL